MWALVKDGQVIKRGKAAVHKLVIDDVQYPDNITKLWSTSELKALGLIPIRKVKLGHDPMFHMDGGNTEVVTDDEVVITNSLVERDVVGVMISIRNKINEYVSSSLAHTDWAIIRQTEAVGTPQPKPIPTYIKLLRAAIRKSAYDMEVVVTAIETQSVLDLKKATDVVNTQAAVDLEIAIAEATTQLEQDQAVENSKAAVLVAIKKEKALGSKL